METKERHPLFMGVEELLAAAQMTCKDLSVWLDRPYMTTMEWLYKGVHPSECYHLDIQRRLDLLRDLQAQTGNQPLLPNRRSRSAAGRTHEILALYAKATGAEPPVLKEETVECGTKKTPTKKPTTKKPKAPSKSASRPSKRGQARSNASPVT